MEALWKRLESWLSVNAPTVLGSLQPGASASDIELAETTLSVQFPEDFKACYRIHNGQADYADLLFDGREFLSLERIQEEWRVWKDLLDGGNFNRTAGKPVGPIRTDWWNPKWIPITYDGSGNHDCLDLAPAEGGHTGQIIDFWHDEATRKVKAESFTVWFAALVEGCESGQYAYSEEYDGIVDVYDL